jgi:dTMP kinase
MAVGKVAAENHQPDLTVIFDVDETVAAKRLSEKLDRIEQRPAEFHRKVRGGFLQQAKDYPGRYAVIDASREPDAVFAELLATVTVRLAR